MPDEEPFRLMSLQECMARFAAVNEQRDILLKMAEELQLIEKAKSPANTIPTEQLEMHLKTLRALQARLEELKPLTDPSTLPSWLQKKNQ